MTPTQKKKIKSLFMWAAVATSLALVLFAGHSYGRVIDWTSSELIYTPQAREGYSSSYLSAAGRQIRLSDWQENEDFRTVTIPVSRADAAAADSRSADEVTVTLDEAAQSHLVYMVQVSEDTIELRLQRIDQAPGLEQTTTMTVTVQWFGLKGTVTVDMLPYGDIAAGESEQEPAESQVVTGLESMADVHDVMNAQRPVACVKLNLETKADFTLTFMRESELLRGVWWSLNGSDYTLLYDSAELTLNWPYRENWDGCIYLDFSDVLEPDERPVIAVDATSYPRREFKPVWADMPEASGLVLKTTRFPYTITMQPTWGEAILQVARIERLEKDSQENLVYMQDTSLTASVSDSGIVLIPTVAEKYPQPGSYRLVAQWSWNGVVADEQILYFFINTN